ncbi:MAG: SPOR domain-containing protein, partial [Alphaproteobacteria bacterium]|nr:SPOR domain-containing protein [Alphaproteobacteria bacterium]
EVLRIKEKGTARVRVEILPEESKNLKDLAMASQNTDIYEPNIAYSSAEIQPAEASKVEEPAPAPAPAPEPAPVAEPAPMPEPTPAPVVAPSSNNGPEYFVQVAAYSTYEKAEAMKDKLTTFGTVKIFKSVVNGETLYKVRLGEFSNKDEAERVQRQVTDSGINGSRVILKEDGAFKWNIK